ncbi:MAG: hypothetical protein J6X45_05575 [Lachnospiraceae bacterium]|nr:hypothetical protein [Lachnospiraceae bacterium]
MASYLDKYRRGAVYYLVYYYRGDIRVQAGYPDGKTFTLRDQNKWLVGCPHCCGYVNSKGKVLCRREEDIPAAKQMIREHYINKISEVENTAVSRLYNIQKMIENNRVVGT